MHYNRHSEKKKSYKKELTRLLLYIDFIRSLEAGYERFRFDFRLKGALTTTAIYCERVLLVLRRTKSLPSLQLNSGVGELT